MNISFKWTAFYILDGIQTEKWIRLEWYQHVSDAGQRVNNRSLIVHAVTKGQ